MKIGIFDSGLGGLIITRAIRKMMPEYDYVYYGDTKRVPYGNKSNEEVYEFTREAIDNLFRKEDCAIIIMACNTASARALKQIEQDYLPKNFPDRKILGVIVPTAEVAASYKKVGILATSSTVASNTFPIEIEKLNKQTEVLQNEAPMLVPIIEENENHLSEPFLIKYLRPFMNKNLDALVLGCTHYPLLKKEIKKILVQENENMKIISQDEIIPKKIREYFEKHAEITKKLSQNKSIKILVTSKTEHMERLAKRWIAEWDQQMNKAARSKFTPVLEIVSEAPAKNTPRITKPELEKEMSEIVDSLKAEKKYRLAQSIEQNWDKTAILYSRELNTWSPSREMEPVLLRAFEKELERLGVGSGTKTKILNSLQQRRIIQTAPHLVATEGPRMFSINWLSSLGVHKNDFYVVAMFSGVPFSNSFRPGRINRKDSSVNLFPSNMQDALVYRSQIQNKLIESVKDLPPEIKKFLPDAKEGESYTRWALLTCQNIERQILQKENLVFLDINEVVSNYLVEALKDPNHVLYKIFFDPKTQAQFMKAFPNELLFYCSAKDGKYETMENMTLGNKTLKSKSREILLNDPKILQEELENGQICPALIISFLVLAFLNQFKCFGSFAQVEYLPVYQEKFAKLDFMKIFKIESVPTSNLTTGVFPSDTDIFPADLIIQNEKLNPEENLLFGELLLKIKDKLMSSYFVGDQRKNGKK